MARIYQPLQRKSDGRWDFTVSSDEEHWAHPDGYCRGDFSTAWPEDAPRPIAGQQPFWPWRDAQDYAKDRATRLPFAAKYHSDGHATAEEAIACHRGYELDLERRTYDEPDVQQKCQQCGAWTTRRVEVGQFNHLTLCETHDTRDDAAAVIEAERQKRQGGVR